MRATIDHSLEGARWKPGLASKHQCLFAARDFTRREDVLSDVQETNVELISGLHDDPKILRIPKRRPALRLTLRRKDRLELFFEGWGHGQAFDNHVVQGSTGDRVQGHSRFLGFGDELGIRKVASTARPRSRGTPGGMA
jgi:hypothetical protein